MGCNSSRTKASSPEARLARKSKIKCLLGCDQTTSPRKNEQASNPFGAKTEGKHRDYSHEPMYAIFKKHDKDQDGRLKKGEVIEALNECGIRVLDEDLAFEWLDRNFDNALEYKEFRRATEKATTPCPVCLYHRNDSSDEDG